jgi:uncharacterized membrane protein YadS
MLRSILPAQLTPLLDGLARAARIALVLTLYLIGLGLTRGTLRQVGPKPLLQGVLLWALLGGTTLLAVREWVTG